MSTRLPLHRSVADLLRRRIQAGEWSQGGRLPAEDELANILSVGRSTVREALRALEQEGLVVRRHGVGSFLLPNAQRVMGNLQALESFTEAIQRSGHVLRVQSVDISRGAALDDVAEALDLKRGADVWKVQNLYWVDERPGILTRSILPVRVVGDQVSMRAKLRDRRVREFLKDEKGIEVTQAYLSILAVGATPETASIIEVELGSPLLLLAGPSYDTSGQPIYYTEAFFNTDVYQFNVVRH